MNEKPSQSNSSPDLESSLTGMEFLQLAAFPDEMLQGMPLHEVAMLVRVEPEDWPDELRAHVEKFVDLD